MGDINKYFMSFVNYLSCFSPHSCFSCCAVIVTFCSNYLISYIHSIKSIMEPLVNSIRRKSLYFISNINSVSSDNSNKDEIEQQQQQHQQEKEEEFKVNNPSYNRRDGDSNDDGDEDEAKTSSISPGRVKSLIKAFSSKSLAAASALASADPFSRRPSTVKRIKDKEEGEVIITPYNRDRDAQILREHELTIKGPLRDIDDYETTIHSDRLHSLVFFSSINNNSNPSKRHFSGTTQSEASTSQNSRSDEDIDIMQQLHEEEESDITGFNESAKEKKDKNPINRKRAFDSDGHGERMHSPERIPHRPEKKSPIAEAMEQEALWNESEEGEDDVIPQSFSHLTLKRPVISVNRNAPTIERKSDLQLQQQTQLLFDDDEIEDD